MNKKINELTHEERLKKYYIPSSRNNKVYELKYKEGDKFEVVKGYHGRPFSGMFDSHHVSSSQHTMFNVQQGKNSSIPPHGQSRILPKGSIITYRTTADNGMVWFKFNGEGFYCESGDLVNMLEAGVIKPIKKSMNKKQFEIYVNKMTKKILLEQSDFSKLTVEKMVKSYPVKNTEIMRVLKLLLKNRKVKIEKIYKNSNTRIYSTFAQLQLTLPLVLLDSGSSDVLPSGTLYSKENIPLQFHFRGYWNDKGKVEFSINASKNTPGGMAIYKSYPVNNINDIKIYFKSVLDDNKPNNIKTDVY